MGSEEANPPVKTGVGAKDLSYLQCTDLAMTWETGSSSWQQSLLLSGKEKAPGQGEKDERVQHLNKVNPSQKEGKKDSIYPMTMNS